MRARVIFLYLFLGAGMALNGQYTKEFKRIYFDADYLMETGFYEEAFNRYKNLLTLDPGNYNILFHCGACCLNIPGKEKEAVTYLKEASEGVTLSYKEKSHKEPGAPVMTYFMLGQAYMLNYQFSDALTEFTNYIDIGTKENPDQLDYARLQIEDCKRAAHIEKTRPYFEFHGVLEHFENDLPSCSNPVISGDGNTLIFLVDYPSDKKIMMTTRKDSVWSRPRVINSEIGMVGETYPVSISFDGKDLYLSHHYYSHSDIFVSHLQGNRWSEAEALGYQVNRRTSEDHASISRDGKSLYFTSDAKGGYGSFDIYVSHLDEKGEWGEPVNLGPVINTPYEERTPFISRNDSILFFSSQGHASIGGQDVFYSRLRKDGTWSEPQNMGYPVNTTGDDLFYNPGWDEQEGYYAVRKEDDPTSNTITSVMALQYEDEPARDVPFETVQAEPLVAQTNPVADTTAGGDRSEPLTTEIIEPPNTDEIEMVLNDRTAEANVEPEPVKEPVVAADTEPAGTPLERSAFTNELVTTIPFLTNEYEMGPQAQLEVEKVAELMTYYPESKVVLTGHTDSTGMEEFNRLLSMQRAGEVADYLEMRGIGMERITVEGNGEADPVAKNSFSDGSDALLGRYLNRQVHVRITGTLPVDNYLSGLYVPVNLRPVKETTPETIETEFHYTIQIMATSKPIPDPRFKNVSSAREYVCTDGYYRYTTISYHTFREARARLLWLRKHGYEDAFIQTREWYEKAIR